MDSINLLSNQQNIASTLSSGTDAVNTDDISQKRAKELSRNFESLLVNKLLDEMNNTIDCFSDDKDSATSQIQGIFSMYLSEHVADNGGIGLWKEIYKQIFTDTQLSNSQNTVLDESL